MCVPGQPGAAAPGSAGEAVAALRGALGWLAGADATALSTAEQAECALLSGPAGLASRLRTTRLTGPAASISLPLDCGTATDTIPAHMRRAA